MAELLLELLSEEIPARMQGRAAKDLERLVLDGLKGAGLAFGRAEAYATPRRLALVVDGIPERQPDVREERKGPRADAPEKAIQGFLGSVGLASVAQCETRETAKGTFLFAVAEKKGVATEEVLPGILTEAIRRVPWPKSMRWADTGFRWVRPLHSILALFAGEPLTGVLDLHGATLHFGVTTRGHRFLSPARIEVRSFADYRRGLEKAYVILDAAARRASIERQLAEIAATEGLTVRPDPALLDEVTGLVEWPVVLTGAIDEAFMDVPAEALTASMRTHQKYFSLLNPDGSLAPRFALVANMEAPDGGKQIVAGNERVLRARLADAKFFWDQDRRTKLVERIPALDGVTFHAKLGTLGNKASWIESLAREIAMHVPKADPSLAARAGLLAKADLVTGMVGEFPELQGTMGRYYALNNKDERPNVALAIGEHYAPQGPNDYCPTVPVSVAVALADKINTLAAFWSIDEKPTGSKDPYALRRAALGVIRLILENDLRIPLLKVFYQASTPFLWDAIPETQQALAHDLLDFFADRLKVYLREQNVRHDFISAIFALGGEDDLVRLLARVHALEAFLRSDDGANLLIAYRRAANILRIEEKKDDTSHAGDADPARFRQDEEKRLSEALKAASAAVQVSVTKEEFSAAMAALARLRAPVDAFFDNVTVNAEQSELRANRLKLLSGIRDTMGAVADFSQIEG